MPKASHPQPRGQSPEARVDASIAKHADGCWIWTGADNGAGYGITSVAGRPVGVHRFQYERYVGPIPDGMHIDHLCRVRACCNPDHLEAVTPRENLLRSPITQASINAAKTHCPQGHAYTPDNVYIQRTRNGGRLCKRCVNEASSRRYAERKAAAATA